MSSSKERAILKIFELEKEKNRLLKIQLEASKKSLKKTEDKFLILKKFIEKVQTENDSLREYQTKVNEINASNLEDLKKELINTEEELAFAISNDKNEIIKENKALKRTLKNLYKKTDELEIKNLNIDGKKENIDYKERFEFLQRECKRFKDDIKEYLDKIFKLEKLIEDYKFENEKLGKEAYSLRDEVPALNSIIKKAVDDNEIIRKKNNDYLSLNNKIRALESKIVNLLVTKDKDKKKLNESVTREGNLQKKIKELKKIKNDEINNFAEIVLKEKGELLTEIKNMVLMVDKSIVNNNHRIIKNSDSNSLDNDYYLNKMISEESLEINYAKEKGKERKKE